MPYPLFFFPLHICNSPLRLQCKQNPGTILAGCPKLTLHLPSFAHKLCCITFCCLSSTCFHSSDSIFYSQLIPWVAFSLQQIFLLLFLIKNKNIFRITNLHNFTAGKGITFNIFILLEISFLPLQLLPNSTSNIQ